VAPAGFTLEGASAAEIVYPTIITVPYSPAGGFQFLTNWLTGTNVSQITINGTVSSVRETLEG
jgi:hypothetical protein